jgi:hypothetical protein
MTYLYMSHSIFRTSLSLAKAKRASQRCAQLGVFMIGVTLSLAACAGSDIAIPEELQDSRLLPMPAVTVEVNEQKMLDLTRHFGRDVRQFRTMSSDTAIATSEVVGVFVTVTGVRKGLATITVEAIATNALGRHEHFPVTVPNRPPRLRDGRDMSQLDVNIVSGMAALRDFSDVFEDPDGDALTYTAEFDRPDIAEAQVEGDAVWVMGISEGQVVLRVRAGDGESESVAVEIPVTIRAGFPIEMEFVTEIAERYTPALRKAQERWSRILAPTRLSQAALAAGSDPCPTVPGFAPPLEGGWRGRGVLVYVRLASMSGSGVAAATICRTRSDGAPLVGAVIINEHRVRWLFVNNLLHDTMLHELGHVFGIGSLWHGMIEATKDGGPYFTGPLARKAFDAAGGSSYDGPKVPVQVDLAHHWRAPILGGELMSPSVGDGMALSEITLSALADLGYEVDMSEADAYSLAAADGRLGPVLDLSGDVWDVGDLAKIKW